MATNPAGAVTFTAAAACPSGWIEANGQSTGAYPTLAAVVGTAVPDLRGEFLRGWDHGRGIDAGRLLASAQTGTLLSGENQAIQSVISPLIAGDPGIWGMDTAALGNYPSNLAMMVQTAASFAYVDANHVGIARPANVALIPCVATGQ